MENENSNEEPLITEEPVKKVVKDDKRSSILKQLDNNKLYPLQERIGLYIIAALSTIGLVLIGYTGVMAIASNGNIALESPVVDAEEVHDMLGELNLEDASEDDELEEEEFESNHEYVEQEEDDNEPEDDDEDEEATPASATGTVVNGDTGLRAEPGSTGARLGVLEVGVVVEIIDLDSNPFWAFVSVDGLEGYVDKGFLEAD